MIRRSLGHRVNHLDELRFADISWHECLYLAFKCVGEVVGTMALPNDDDPPCEYYRGELSICISKTLKRISDSVLHEIRRGNSSLSHHLMIDGVSDKIGGRLERKFLEQSRSIGADGLHAQL